MASSELFTVTFWQVTLTQVVHATAGAAAGALLTGVVHNIDGSVSVPWWGVLLNAAIAGLSTLLLALAGQQLPSTGVASFLPAGRAVRRPAPARKGRAYPGPAKRGN
jgi:hypothetical protein